jgi:DNA-directed RNA polymerase subunit RPC12/RpoP
MLMGAENAQFLRCDMRTYKTDMKEPDMLTDEELDGLARSGPQIELDWTGEYICIDCISEVNLSFSLGWTRREACPRCAHRSTLYEALERRLT